jgi:glycerol uptake facilitator-like aquaporin
MQRRDASTYAAELVGTFLLVLFVALVLTVYSRTGIGSTDMVVVGLVQAFVLRGRPALRPVDKLGRA